MLNAKWNVSKLSGSLTKGLFKFQSFRIVFLLEFRSSLQRNFVYQLATNKVVGLSAAENKFHKNRWIVPSGTILFIYLPPLKANYSKGNNHILLISNLQYVYLENNVSDVVHRVKSKDSGTFYSS